MLDKWDYSCNQKFSYKDFTSTKLWNKIKLHINLYTMGSPFSMLYTEILSDIGATNICWTENNPDGKRAFSRSLLSAIVAHNYLSFLKIFSNLVHFCPDFQICCPFLTFFFCLFFGKWHACLLFRINLR